MLDIAVFMAFMFKLLFIMKSVFSFCKKMYLCDSAKLVLNDDNHHMSVSCVSCLALSGIANCLDNVTKHFWCTTWEQNV